MVRRESFNPAPADGLSLARGRGLVEYSDPVGECLDRATCADELNAVCKNCFDNLVVRPIRLPERLADYPASTVRVFNPHNCPVRNPALLASGTWGPVG